MTCIHSCSGFCRKYTHDCANEDDRMRCPEWRMILSINNLAVVIDAMNAMRARVGLKIQGLN